MTGGRRVPALLVETTVSKSAHPDLLYSNFLALDPEAKPSGEIDSFCPRMDSKIMTRSRFNHVLRGEIPYGRNQSMMRGRKWKP